MTFWPLTNSDYPTNQTFHQFHDLDTDFDLHRITSGFHGAFATGVACQQGTLTLPDTWFRPPFWDLLMLQLVRPNSSNLPCLYSIFHLEYPLVLSRICILTRFVIHIHMIVTSIKPRTLSEVKIFNIISATHGAPSQATWILSVHLVTSNWGSAIVRQA